MTTAAVRRRKPLSAVARQPISSTCFPIGGSARSISACAGLQPLCGNRTRDSCEGFYLVASKPLKAVGQSQPSSVLVRFHFWLLMGTHTTALEESEDKARVVIGTS